MDPEMTDISDPVDSKSQVFSISENETQCFQVTEIAPIPVLHHFKSHIPGQLINTI